MSLQESEFHEFIQELVEVPYRIAIPTYNRPEIFINKTLQYLDRCIVNRNNIDVFVEDEYQLSLYLATCANEYPELNYIVTHKSFIC